MAVRRVGIVGGGLMGSGIAEVCLRGGCDTMVVEVSPAAADAARQRILASLDRGVERGKFGADVRDAAVDRLVVSDALGDLAGSDLVVEAVVEDATLKCDVFERLDATLGPGAVLASNTSSIPIIDLAAATGRPEAVVGLHFFNPVPVMELVEVIPSLATDDHTVDVVIGFAEDQLGKTAVRAPDRGGFIVNALLVPYLLDAIRMVEGGHSTATDVDKAMRLGAGHPLGPLAVGDLIGLDTLLHIAESLYHEFGEERMAAPPLLRRMVAAGRLGRKSGSGFFEY